MFRRMSWRRHMAVEVHAAAADRGEHLSSGDQRNAEHVRGLPIARHGAGRCAGSLF